MNLEKLGILGDIAQQGAKAHHYVLRLTAQKDLGKAIDLVRETQPQGLAVRPASLEDVFIELTGKSLESEEEHA